MFNQFPFLSAESPEDSLATVQPEEVFQSEEKHDFFQVENPIEPQEFHLGFSDFGW